MPGFSSRCFAMLARFPLYLRLVR
ncbi:hypothetical protein, partial [Burkholderia cenocepacia]